MPPMFLNGGAMRGEPIHHLLRDAPLIAETTTARRYRLWSVRGEFPALEPVSTGGVAVRGELYDLPLEVLRDSLLPAEPVDLELAVVALHDGTASLGMVLRQSHPQPSGLVDISATGGWREYQKGEV